MYKDPYQEWEQQFKVLLCQKLQLKPEQNTFRSRSMSKVDFRAGSRYHHHDITEDMFEALLNADYKGWFLNNAIKGRYDYEPVV